MPRGFGLRARVIAAFGIGALLLSLLLSGVVYSLTRGNLLEQRVDDVLKNAVVNAQGLNAELGRLGPSNVGEPAEIRAERIDLLNQFVVPVGAYQGLRINADVYWTDLIGFNDDRLPQSLIDLSFDGTPATMVFDAGSESFYAVVLPLPRVNANAVYIEAASLAEVESTLGSLLATLIGASAVTTVLGLGFGIYVATRIFNPLSEISGAAAQIAEGDLSTRLQEGDDPDLDQLVASFNNMTNALQQRIERDARFASDVSHELRSPLMTLTGSSAVLEKRRDEMPEPAQVALDLLSTDIRRFKQLVEDLLEISRFDIGAVELDKDEVLVTEFVRQALHAANRERVEVPIIHGPDSEDLIALLDKRRIAQVIRNLSENADKYAGGVTQARIVRLPDNGLRIDLEDEGPGVPEEERSLIFERFARGSEGGRRGSSTGVGLGLSLVTEHLRLHHGSIRVADRIDRLQGARFVIELPGVVVDE